MRKRLLILCAMVLSGVLACEANAAGEADGHAASAAAAGAKENNSEAADLSRGERDRRPKRAGEVAKETGAETDPNHESGGSTEPAKSDPVARHGPADRERQPVAQARPQGVVSNRGGRQLATGNTDAIRSVMSATARGHRPTVSRGGPNRPESDAGVAAQAAHGPGPRDVAAEFRGGAGTATTGSLAQAQASPRAADRSASIRAVAANGVIGGPRPPVAVLGGPTASRTTHSAVVNGASMRRKF
jgi:hypothetical protein